MADTQQIQERIAGTVEHIVFKNDDTGYAVIELSTKAGDVTVVGEMAGVSVGETLTVVGQYVNHHTFGPQFKAAYCEYQLPQTASAILRYLSEGALPGIGPVTAKRMVEAFGDQTLEIIASEPAKLAKIRGFTPKKAEQVNLAFKEKFGVREAIVYLAKVGVHAAQAIEVYKLYGAFTIDLLESNPYMLCAEPARLPFSQVDTFALQKHGNTEDENRVTAGIAYVLRHNAGNGHTCLPHKKLLPTVCSFINVEPSVVSARMDAMLETGRLFKENIGGESFIFLPDLMRAERFIAMALRQMASLPAAGTVTALELKAAQESLNVELAPLQLQGVEMAAASNCSILTGGPGTGKTTTVRAILAVLESRGERVVLAAPTGRAAKRLSELSGRKAKTIHRLLEVAYGTHGEHVKFIHNEENPLRCDVVVVDEMSMVDVYLFESLLRGLPPHCRILLVGDPDQLPPVGPGNILKDALESGTVPSVTLSEVFRQAGQSLIVTNAHGIVKGELPKQGKGADSDFFFIEQRKENFGDFLEGLVLNRLPKTYGLDPLHDIQILTPTKIGAGGTEQLNAHLQSILNPPAKGKGQVQHMGRTFRTGDKVMQIRNNYDIVFNRDDGEEGVGAFNGDIGFILEANVRGGFVEVRFEDRVYVYNIEQLNELELAYAITIHKSQGSEFKAVVLPVLGVGPKLRYRNLLYTGVTRAQNLLVIVGSSTEVADMVQNDRKTLRYSALKTFLQDDSFI